MLAALLIPALVLAVPRRAPEFPASGASEAAVDAAGELRPERLRVLLAGVVRWRHADAWEPFEAEGRRDRELAAWLRARGVPPDRLTELYDEAATRARLEAALADQVARSEPDDVLLFFFAGHGAREGREAWLIPHDCGPDARAGGWSARAIVDRLERSFRGRAVLLVVDCCHSGALLEEAAGRQLPFPVGGLASAAPRCASTARWTFTDLVLEGLRGARACDADGDGAVTLGELGAHVQGGMAFLEEQMAPYAAAWDPVLARASTSPAAPRAGDRLEVLQDGTWYRARVHAARSGDAGEELRVHYAGWDCGEDEWVTPDRVRPWRAPDLAAGAEVRARRGGRWRPATVLETRHGLLRVRWDDRPRSRGAWLAPARVRRPTELAPR